MNAVELSNLDRVLWPEAGFTKGDMIAYYERVAPALLPHVRERALTLWRYPSGVHERGWWQNVCRGAPEWMTTHEQRGQRFCVVNDLPSLLWVANQGTVELHPFLDRIDHDEPDVLVFDLDPGPGADIADCAAIALLIRDRVDRALAKTSGSLGLHVYAPAQGSYADAKAAVRELANELADAHPERVVTTQQRARREGRVLVDWLQNDPTRSTVAPYSLRAMTWPTVSMPVTWDEVEECANGHRPEVLTFVAHDVERRLNRYGDVFAPLIAAP